MFVCNYTCVHVYYLLHSITLACTTAVNSEEPSASTYTNAKFSIAAFL